MARKTQRYVWENGDFTISNEINLPDDLKKIVSEAPSGDQAIGRYLIDLVSDGKITTDDMIFIIDSGILQ